MSEASVAVDGEVVGRVGRGLLALVGVAATDTAETSAQMARKVAGIRLFPSPNDPERKPIDADLHSAGGAVLAVSQFTLCADTSRGRRPSFTGAARPETAAPLFEVFVAGLRAEGIVVECGRFGAHMHVTLTNDGPVTIVLDS